MRSVKLGKVGPEISEIGMGAWAWGDRLFWNYGQGYGKADVREAFQQGLKAGVTFFDTAEVYGFGRSERLLGEFLQESAAKPVIASKCFPYPWRLSGRSLKRALKKSLGRLELQQLDLYQMHWPNPPVSIESWMHAMADALEAGLIKHIGVSNYGPRQVERAQKVLERRRHSLASNQILYSLLARGPEFNGLLQLCKEMGVTVLAYSPIGQGLLSGKYTTSKPPRGSRRFQYGRAVIKRAVGIVEELKEIGKRYGGKSPAQVAINWTMGKGTVPIPGAKTWQQAKENLGAVGWALSQEDMARLDAISAKANA